MIGSKSQGSVLPPDIKQQMQATSRGGGIGSRAHENAETARQREAALNPDQSQEDDKAKAAPTTAEELKICPNARCQTPLNAEWHFCAKCGGDLIRGGAAKRLGLVFEKKDVQDYIFKGYIVRELKILGDHTLTLKSSQTSDVDKIDAYIMDGKWSKKADGSARPVSDFFVRQINQLAMAAASVMKIDGSSIGETIESRMDYLFEKGTAFVDLISARVQLFNKAVTDHLNQVDTLPGS